jgi:hypothetical protein
MEKFVSPKVGGIAGIRRNFEGWLYHDLRSGAA